MSVVWGRTLLTVYGNLDSVCKAIDSLVMRKGLSSCNYGFDPEGTFKQMNNMINLIERKAKFLYLKNIIDKGLKAMNPEISKFAIFRFIDKFSYQTIAQITSLSLRTVQRKAHKAADVFCVQLARLGYPQVKLAEIYGNEPLIEGVLERLTRDGRSASKNKSDNIGLDNFLISRSMPVFSFNNVRTEYTRLAQLQKSKNPKICVNS